MDETVNLTLPLLQPSQAQKHVTVNEALVRLDAACQLVMKSVSTATPPGLASEGDVYGVPPGGVNAWDLKDGQVAIYTNGGWVYLTPKAGWRGWVEDTGASALFDGTSWRSGFVTSSANGSGLGISVTEFDHVIGAGATSQTSFEIAPYDLVIGVTGRVLLDVTGTAIDWKLGVAGDLARYGNGIGMVQGSWLRGVSTHPYAYYANTPLVLSSDTGDFAGGMVRFAVHRINLSLPQGS